jgi:hypothetical protein
MPECGAESIAGLRCTLNPDHDGPHMHFDANGTTAWDLMRLPLAAEAQGDVS